MKFGVVIFHRTKKIIYADFCRKFFTYLTFQGILGHFTSFHFPTRKLPPVLPFAISTLSSEYLITFADYRCYDFYVLHMLY